MADSSQKTEKPTPRRLEKARQEGRFVTSREAVSAAGFATAVWLLVALTPGWFERSLPVWRRLLAEAFHGELTLQLFYRLWRIIAAETLVPLVLAGAATVVAMLGLQTAITGFGFATKRLAPSWSRLNPANRLRELPGQNLFQAAQGLAVVLIFGLLLAARIPQWMEALRPLPRLALDGALAVLGGLLADLFRQSVGIFALLGAADFVRQRARYLRDLRMSRQEIRDEVKESEGNPQIKQRIRRLQRDVARRRMMDKVPQATAVVVNPTHYAVALHYEAAALGAPKVVAKGRNYLARRIREIALLHEVPIIENPPLARSLYQHCEVGQEIPVQFYRAVAEILAYIFRLMNRRSGAP